MKFILNTVIILLIMAIWSDLEKSSISKEIDFSSTIYALCGLLIFGFFRVYYKDAVEYFTTYR